jgi:trehalose 6-phosphate phosphatase
LPDQTEPDLAKINPKLAKKIENMADKDWIKIAIITGRSINDFLNVSSFSSKKITVSGLHGGEILHNGQLEIQKRDPKEEQTANKFLLDIQKQCQNLDGILLENKGFSIALHYRMATEKIAEKAINIFMELMHKYNAGEFFKIQTGKKVVEMLPSKFQKSTIVKGLIEKYPKHAPFYFGDDITDICAFEEVKRHNGICIGITPLPFEYENLIDVEISQENLEKFILRLK